ncbi:hypothetical protein PV325_013170, partial [Microctonus aethiopoides]
MNNRPQPPNTPSLLLSMSRIVNNHDTNNHDDDNNLNSDAIGDNFMNRESNYSAFYADYEFDENKLGHTTLPKTAQALLQTQHHQVVDCIRSLKETH